MRTYKTGILGYNPKTRRFGLLVMDLWEIDGFHCGDTMQIYDKGKWIETRIEKKSSITTYNQDYWNWYLINTNYTGYEMEGLRVRIK